MSDQFLTLDQSLGKCAWMYWSDGRPVAKGVIRTGDSSAKVKKKGVTYLDGVDRRIDRICDELINIMIEQYPHPYEASGNQIPVIFEGLSFGSAGNATRDLAGLYYTLRYSLVDIGLTCYEGMHAYVPTSIKALARDYLPVEKQTEISKNTGKPVKCKMDKKLMVEACEAEMGKDFLKGYNYSNGKDDLADAYWLGRLYMNKECQWIG